MLVVKGIDIIKYFIKIAIVVLLLFFATKIFLPISNRVKKFKLNVQSDKLISCLNENIPLIKQVNEKKEQKKR